MARQQRAGAGQAAALMSKASKRRPKAPTQIEVEIQRPNIQVLTLKLVGDGMLVTHNWSEKAKQEMLDKQMGKAKGKKRPKSPPECFIDSMHWISKKPIRKDDKDGRSTWTMADALKAVAKAKFGFPAIAFKAAYVSACRQTDITMTQAKGTIHIDADLIEINAPPPQMREDMVRIGNGGTADIRYRAEFRDWSVVVPVRYNASAVTVEKVVALFSIAGFAVGIGEGRPEKRDMGWGRYHVAAAGE